MTLKTVFMGTPYFAEIILRKLYYSNIVNIISVYTQPDKPCGRGLKCTSCQCKVAALELNLPIVQVASFKDDIAYEFLLELNPDIIIVAAYGLILPQRILSIPKFGCINVHASLLPKYRGAAPIQRSLLAGDKVTGATIMMMNKDLDSGDILAQKALILSGNETYGDLLEEIAIIGSDLLLSTLDNIMNHKMIKIPQDNNQATYAHKVSKNDCLLSFIKSALDVHNHVRAFSPSPGAFFKFSSNKFNKPLTIQIELGHIGEVKPDDVSPGTIIGLTNDFLSIACSDNFYLIPRVKPSGKNWMSARDFFCGYLSKTCDFKICC